VTAGLTPSAAERTEAIMTAYQEAIAEQLDEGLRAIQHTANTLMHEIAAEVWRSAGGDKAEVAGTILQELSRDQAIRSLITHSDERFQALAARTGRLEDGVTMLAESVRAAREAIQQATDALADTRGTPAGVSQIRTELSEITRQVAAAFEALAERDRAIVETVQAQIAGHGQLIAQETARISQAMEAYVQHGVEAMGQLAGSTDTQVHSITARDEEITQRVNAAIDRRMAALGEQLQLVYDRMGSGTTSLHEELTFLSERIGVDARETVEAIGHMVDVRARGVAQLVRSDSEALRGELVRSAEAHDRSLALVLDERLGRVTDAVTRVTASMSGEVASRVRDEVSDAIRLRLDEAVARLETRAEDQSRVIDARMNEVVTAIDRNVVRLSDSMEGQLERMGKLAGERAAAAANLAIGTRFDEVAGRLQDATTAIERAHSESRSTAERNATQMAELRRGMEERQMSLGRELGQTMDTRIAALAKLVRSDNEMLAAQIAADQEASKQALRMMKELQASMPAELIGMVEERFASLAESIERSNEMLAARIDRMAEKIGRQQNDEIQVVIDRMGDAMHALASLGKPGASPSAQPHIELE
jgi:uncharacterized phage infection (PIP) family protein YhgE